MIIIIFLLLFTTVFGYAEITTDVEITPGGTIAGGSDDLELVWQQLPGTISPHALSSQYFIDFDQTSEVADDVRLEFSFWINGCRWWGTYWNPGGTAWDPEFSIYIYPDIGEEPAAPYSGLHLVEYTVPSGTTGENYVPAIDRYVYQAVIGYFTLEQNTKYWFVYQCHLDFGTQGQWGIASTDEGDIWEHDVWFTGNAFGYTTWQNGVNIFGYEVDIAHELGEWLSLEQTTWGSIKTVF